MRNLAPIKNCWLALCLALPFLGLVPDTAWAKEVPPLQVLETPRFRIHHTQRATGAARALASDIEDVRDEFRHTLGRDWPGVTDIRLGFDREEFEALSLDGKPPGWAVALAYPSQNIILLDAHGLNAPNGRQTLFHELSHVALGQIAQGDRWPRWFQEGLAMYLTGERFSLAQYSVLFRAVNHDRLFSFEHLGSEWPQSISDVELAYAQSVTFLSFLVDRYGPSGLAQLLDGMQAGDSFETAFAKAFRTSLWLEELAWKQSLPSRYSWWPLVTGGSTLWLIASLIAVVGYLRRRRQKHAALRRMDFEEEAAALSTASLDSTGFVPLAADGSTLTEEEPLHTKDKPTFH